MINHPNRARTYWILHPRKFENEYTIGVATTKADAEQYRAEGFTRIDRSIALGKLSYRPPSHEQVYASVTVDGEARWDCYEVARAIRTGSEV